MHYYIVTGAVVACSVHIIKKFLLRHNVHSSCAAIKKKDENRNVRRFYESIKNA